MIYTVTLNPSLDYYMSCEDEMLGKINLSTKEEIVVGGKGINVSLVLANLNMDSICLGFAGGFVGKQIEKELKQRKVETNFIHIKDNSRINVKINGDKETAFNGNGPIISSKDLDKLYGQVEKLQVGDILVLSGSIPRGCDEDIYEKIIQKVNKKVLVICDTTKNRLLCLLKHHPFLVKPNLEELSDIFNVDLSKATIGEIAEYGFKLNEQGALNVIISLGSKGAILTSEGMYHYLKGIEVNDFNTVGAGDSLVAGFIYEFIKTQSIIRAFYYGVSAGNAKVFSKKLPNKEEIEEILQQITEI